VQNGEAAGIGLGDALFSRIAGEHQSGNGTAAGAALVSTLSKRA
jgi:hypothetical protein